jgi:chloramphenicol O-acetyltransferase type B
MHLIDLIFKFLKAVRGIILRFYCLVFKIRIKYVVAKYDGSIYVGGATYLTKQTYLSNNVNFNGMRVIGVGNLYIGQNFHSGPGCLIITSNHNYKGEALPYDNIEIPKNVVIKDNVWLGNNVIILPGITLGEGSIIQAGSVVSIDIPDFAIAGGNPAKPFKFRDLYHYNDLKKQQKYN